MGLPWMKWGSLFSITDIRSGFPLAELMAFQMCGFSKTLSRSPPTLPEADARILQALLPSLFGMGLET